MLDKNKILQTLRANLLTAEVVQLSETGALKGIREGTFTSATMIRPDDPEIRTIIDVEQFDIIERPFNSENFTLFVQETFMPNVDGRVSYEMTGSAGIYELVVMVPSDNGAITNIQSAWNVAKYIEDVFDQSLPDLEVNQAGNQGLCIDNIELGPPDIDIDTDSHYMIPIYIEWRTYNLE